MHWTQVVNGISKESRLRAPVTFHKFLYFRYRQFERQCVLR